MLLPDYRHYAYIYIVTRILPPLTLETLRTLTAVELEERFPALLLLLCYLI